MHAFINNTLLLATHNQGKVREISELLKPLNLKIISAAEKNLPEPDETETTFVGNARLKAVAAAQASGMTALADDSGFCVDALDGAPGVYSARWARADYPLSLQGEGWGEGDKNALSSPLTRPSATLSPQGRGDKDFKLAMQRVHDALLAKNISFQTRPRASFVCVLALAQPDGTCETFEGKIDGHIIWPPRGEKGFGYDPIFVPDGYDQTFAEIVPAVKNAISHRARAFEKLMQKFQ